MFLVELAGITQCPNDVNEDSGERHQFNACRDHQCPNAVNEDSDERHQFNEDSLIPGEGIKQQPQRASRICHFPFPAVQTLL